ncbi:PhnD/SsuA/transferrin family substrate-binding protein [Desulfobacterales bacterium HSG2]|nr:PhnD/SsuA/transferrin family substrate-binding protein [Desulfobacterales bacterium HSG2]
MMFRVSKVMNETMFFLMFVFLIGFSDIGQSWAADKQTFLFGFGHRLEAAEEAKIYAPFLQYLFKKTGYRFAPRFVQKSESMPDLIGKGHVQFMAFGSVEYIHASERYKVIPLVRGLNSQNKAAYQAAIVTQPDSNIKTVRDIRGRTFAFGSSESTQGHLIPRIMLLKSGITLKDLKDHTYTGSHSKAGQAVFSRRYDAGGLQDTLAKNLEKKGLVRIVAMSDFYPSSGVAANKNVKPEIAEAVKSALLEFEPLGRDKKRLYHWERTEMPNGFVKASESDYNAIRDAMLKMGLLEKRKEYNR